MSDVLQLLLIDDDEVDRMAVRRALEASGLAFEMEEAVAGKMAVTLLQQQKFDCALLDYRLPQIDGLEVLQQVRTAGIHTPIIILTGQGGEKIAVEIMKAGAADYLPKASITPGSLARSIRSAVRTHRAEMETARAQEALREHAQELKERNEELNAFVSTIAHDLKEPLQPIIGLADLLEAEFGEVLGEQGLFATNGIRESGWRMVKIIDSLLLLARLRHEQLDLKPLNMTAVVANALKRTAHLCARHVGTITVTVQEEWPAALGYGPWVEEVWVNYISNALKYGGNPPRVAVGATLPAAEQVRFWVRDNGSGLTPESQRLLFAPFTRLHENSKEGHGLGLSIVQRIVDKLGGDVGVESKVNVGSTFWFTLPAVSGNKKEKAPD